MLSFWRGYLLPHITRTRVYNRVLIDASKYMSLIFLEMKKTYISLVISIVLSGALSQSPATFWNDYPACERQCHQTVYGNLSCTLQNTCGCNNGCLCLQDSCLCVTSSWLTAVAQCIGQQCGADAVKEAAGICNSGCNSYGIAMNPDESTFISEGLAAVPSATASSVPASKCLILQRTRNVR